MSRRVAFALALFGFSILMLPGLFAPEHVGTIEGYCLADSNAEAVSVAKRGECPKGYTVSTTGTECDPGTNAAFVTLKAEACPEGFSLRAEYCFQDPLGEPVALPRQFGCPSGYIEGLNEVCNPGDSARFAMVVDEFCPLGFVSEGDYCVAEEARDVTRLGECPDGYAPSEDGATCAPASPNASFLTESETELCPAGFTMEGGYCRGPVPEALAKRGLCPDGYEGGGFDDTCHPEDGAAHASPKVGSCPAGYSMSGGMPEGRKGLGPSHAWPLGADSSGRLIWDQVKQGSSIVIVPSLIAALIVFVLGVLGGLLACTQSTRVAPVVQVLGEVLSALPRLVVVLVVARLVPQESRSLLPIAVVWALLSAPGAMDEAASVAGRLGGSRFVEAMRAHGFSKWRIYFVHVIGFNLRPVLIRQALEVFSQVVLLEIALSYLTATMNNVASLTTASDDAMSWAHVLVEGYKWVPPLNEPSGHALLVGLGLIALVLGSARAAIYAGRAR